jgi:predicted ATP-dependent protease
VNNFKDPYRPNAISMPAGMAREFSHDVDLLVKAARKAIVKVFESEEYANRRSNTAKKFQEQREELFSRINEEARKNDLLIQATPMGLLAIPIVDNRPMNEDEFRALDKKTQIAFSRRQAKLQEKIKKAGRQLAVLEKKTTEMIAKLDQDVTSYTLDNLMDDLMEKYRRQPGITSHLKAMHEDMVENLALFRGDEQKKREGPEASFVVDGELRFRKYKVNAVVDNSELKGAPIVIEMNPTYNTLFGRIEKESQFGTLITDFTMIRAVPCTVQTVVIS